MANGCSAKKRAHKTQVLILQMYQGSELGSLRYDSGMIRGMIRKPIFFGIQEALLLEFLFPTVNLLRLLLCQWLPWLDLPDDLGQDLNMKNVKISMHITSMIYIRRPAGVSSGCSSHVPLAQLRLGLCSSSTEFWFGCQPASQPAAARVIPLISLICNTASN